MHFISPKESSPEAPSVAPQVAGSSEGPQVYCGYIQSVRRLGKICFLNLRSAEGFCQVSLEAVEGAEALCEGMAVRVHGQRQEEARAPGGYEIQARAIEVVSKASRELPFTLAKKSLGLTLETELEQRPLALRHPSNYHRFAIQAALARGFRETLHQRSFHEVFTPKLVSGCAEGGAGVFGLAYFGQEAFLTQSPQLYKQMLVGMYERVFEIGHVYRAEQHNSSRHLNEYVSLDLEAGFVESLEQLMQQQAWLVQHMFWEVKRSCEPALVALEAVLPQMQEIPVLHVREAKQLIHEVAPEIEREEGSLSAAEERALGAVVLQRYAAELVFVTHYHSTARPFYARELGNGETESFDLLFRGMEICTGGLRIHEPEVLKSKMRRLGMPLEPFEHYLSAFEYGLPPHGGSGMGLERITMLLTGGKNVRQAALFPRDRTRLVP